MKKLVCLYGKEEASDVPRVNIVLMCLGFLFILFLAFRTNGFTTQEKISYQKLAIVSDRNIYWVRRLQYIGKHGRPAGTYWDYVILN